MKVCRNCEYYQPITGRCHRYPPAVATYRHSQEYPFVVEDSDWCGEFVITDDRVGIGIDNINRKETP